MPESNHKLTPMEFLAQLKGQSPATAPAAHPDSDSPASDENSEFEEAGRDESGGEGPSGADAWTAEESAPGAESEHAGSNEGSDSPGPDEETGPHEDDNGEAPAAASKPPSGVRGNSKISDLLDRVNTLLGDDGGEEGFHPRAPETLEEAGLSADDVERLVLKLLLAKGLGTGRSISAQLCLPFQIVDPVLKQLKQEQVVAVKGAAEVGDYEFTITEMGRERARRYAEECAYFGPAPVSLYDYLQAMEDQSIARQHASEEALRKAFSDMLLSERMLEKLGPAINSGRALFLFGEPGNGKTSIAERVTRCFESTIWIPRVLGIDGVIIRLYDPGIHEAVEEAARGALFDDSDIDSRWVQIMRPTITAGGELSMQELEVARNPQTKVCEAPLQLKSNCGTLIIDDFGRQTMPVEVLLNRWIVPLEKRYDYLNLPSGKKVQVPFDQLIIFSTNLEPKHLVDDAFLRRIPYKIEVSNPTPDELRELFKFVCPTLGFQYDREAVDYLIETHYLNAGRSMRACHPRDLLLQVKNFCAYKKQPKKLSAEAFDFAVENYFSAM